MSKARTGIGDAFTTIGTTAITIVGAVAVCAGILALGACGQDGAQDAAPQFTGPYAAEFRQLYEEAPSDLVKGIVEDSQITDAEFEEYSQQVASCMEDQGYVWSYDPTQGTSTGAADSSTDMDVDAVNAATASCTAEIGDLTELYGLLHTNPDHLEGDELNRLTLDCLKRHGLADENLTLHEYAAILQDHDRYQNAFGQYSDPQSSPDYNTFYACTTDPVNTD